MTKMTMWFPTLVVSETSFVLDGKRYTDEIIDAVVCGMKKSRVFYSGAFGSGSKPVCSSDDGKIGFERDEKGEVCGESQCAACPKKAECKMYYILLISGETERQKPDFFQLQVATVSGGKLMYQLFLAAGSGLKIPFRFEMLTVEKRVIRFSKPLPAESAPLKVLGSPARGFWEIETGLAIDFTTMPTETEPEPNF
jgi:hypothetical protein